MAKGANGKGDRNLIATSNDPVGRGSNVVHCSGTLDAFNNLGNGTQDFTRAEINSGKNSGASNQNHHQASHSGGESTRLPNHCSGTQSSFNCYGKGSQKFVDAIINSGENSGNRGGPSSGRAGASKQQPRVTGTRDWGNSVITQLLNRFGIGTVVEDCSGTLRSFQNFQSNLQDFTGAKINSCENSGAAEFPQREKKKGFPKKPKLPCQEDAEIRVKELSLEHNSFNNHGNGSQILANARVNSGENSGDRLNNSVSGESTRSPNHCSGTQNSFINDGTRNYTNAQINSGKNSGDLLNNSVSGESTRSRNQFSGSQDITSPRIRSDENSGSRNTVRQIKGHGNNSSEDGCSGTRNSFNCSRNGSQNLENAKINSGLNSGNRSETSTSRASGTGCSRPAQHR